MKIITLDGSKFESEFMAGVTTRHDTDDPDYWSEIDVYRTPKGRFIVHRKLCRKGELKEHVRVLETEDDVQKWLGIGPLCLDLYEELGWKI